MGIDKMVEFLSLDYFINKYSRLGVFVDTDPLLVLLVGKCKPSELRHIGQYNEKDYEIIFSFLKKFQRIVITPYILAEVSDIAENRLEPYFKEFIIECTSFLKNFNERQIKKNKVLNREEAQRLGFPDVSIMISAEIGNLLVVSEDSDLITECGKKGIDVIDFSSLRATAQ